MGSASKMTRARFHHIGRTFTQMLEILRESRCGCEIAPQISSSSKFLPVKLANQSIGKLRGSAVVEPGRRSNRLPDIIFSILRWQFANERLETSQYTRRLVSARRSRPEVLISSTQLILPWPRSCSPSDRRMRFGKRHPQSDLSKAFSKLDLSRR